VSGLLRAFVLGLFVLLAAQGASAQEPAEVIVGVIVEGNQRYSAQQLISTFGLKEGDTLDRKRVDVGLEALWRSFHVVPRVSYRPVEGGVEVLLAVDELPSDFAPRFVGNESVDDDELYEWAGIDPDEELYINRIPLIRQRLIDEYVADGYAFVEITQQVKVGGEDLPEGVTDVYFEIREGPRVKVVDVVYHGNASLPNERFLFWRTGLEPLARVETGDRTLGIFRSVFVRETLDADLVALRNVYRDQGWLDAVVELDHLQFNDERDEVTVHVIVDEGARYTVASLAIEGIARTTTPDDPERYSLEATELFLGEAELLALCDLEVGQPYERRHVDRDGFVLRQHYGEHGYISHITLPVLERFDFLEPRLVYDVERHEVHVTYRLAQGQQHFIQEIRFTGSGKTQDRVYRRELSIFPGELADLKQIEASLRRIRNLTPPDNLTRYRPPASYSFVESSDPAWKDLEFSIGESSILSFNVFASAGSGLGVNGGIDLRLPNFDVTQGPSSWAPWTVLSEIARGDAFHGAGQTLNLRLNPGTEFSTYSLVFREPDIFRRHLDRYSLELFASRTIAGQRSHTEERRNIGLTIGRRLTPDSLAFVGFATGNVQVDDLEVSGEPFLGSPLAVPRLLAEQEGNTDLAYVRFGYSEFDLDFQLAPNSGHSLEFTNRIYDDVLGSDAEFVKSTLDLDYYWPVGEDRGEPRSRLRTRLELGVAWPYGTSDDVPYTERFFLGGTSLRGFERRGVGPNENGFAIGGESMIAARLEYIFPLFSQVQPGTYRKTEQFTGGVFVDAGILDPDAFRADIDELRAAAGFSVSLWLGLPLTLSFAWPLDEGRDDEKQIFRFDIGLR
jgi:outer membrane protein insertion porin family